MGVDGEYLLLRAEGLCSKWGFEDGDILWNDPYMEWTERDFGIGFRIPDHHELLCALVEEYLIPEIPVPIKTFRIGTCHNPIRAEVIDGEEWDSHTSECHPALRGVSVRVPWPDVAAMIRARSVEGN